MLTKDFRRTLIPAVAAQPEVPYRAAYTVCQPSPAPGRWETKCSRIEILVGGSIVIPPGGELVVVHDPTGAIDPLTGQVKVIDMFVRVCTATWKTAGPAGPTVCTTYPAQAYKPAVIGSPARVETSALVGWDAGANSVYAHGGDCECVFTMDRVVGAACGFTRDLAAVTSPTRLEHAWYFQAGKFQVIEGGAAKTASEPYVPRDEFKIMRVSGRVTYFHGARKVYTSRIPSTGEIHVGGALFASSDTIGADKAVPPAAGADSLTEFGSSEALVTLADFDMQVPGFDLHNVVNLLALPGATYTLETANACGTAVAVTHTGGTLATAGVQTTGTCPAAKGGWGRRTHLTTIRGGDFPFPAGAIPLFSGRLFGEAYGSGLSNGLNSIAAIELFDTSDLYALPLGQIRYYSLVPAVVDSNSGTIDAQSFVAMVAALDSPAGLRVEGVVAGLSNAQDGTFQFSTDFPVLVPPPMPKRFYVILEEYWPTSDDPDQGTTTLPATSGTADGVTMIPLHCIATDPWWLAPVPEVDFEFMKLENLDALSENHIYKAGVYSGDEGYQNMVRVGTLKLAPSGRGGS